MSASGSSVIYGLGQKDPLSDYLQFGENLPLISVGNFKTGDQIQVIVSDVTSPSEFWVQIYSPYRKALAKMMADMKEQYDKHDTGMLPTSMLPVRVLQFCVVKADKLWYRAVVIEEPTSHGYIKIRYVDFGTAALVRLTDLRPLRRQWSKLSVQAICSRLIQGDPGTDAWTPHHAVGFSNMVLGVPLVATVITVDTVVNTLCLNLQDPVTNQYTNCKPDKFVNNLVQLPPIVRSGMSHFVLHQPPKLPFKKPPIWRHDCQIFLELAKINPANALQFMTMKIQEQLYI